MSPNVEQNETRRNKFVRLAEQRVNLILEQFRKLGNLSNSKNYDYNEEDIKKIFSELNKVLKKTKNLFLENGKREKKQFRLRG